MIMTAPNTINRTSEKPGGGPSGGTMLIVFVVLVLAAIYFLAAARVPVLGVLCIFGAFFSLTGFYALQPNEAAAITLFGNYKGTDRRTGLRWILPWYKRQKISLRVRNVTSETLKVNDKNGNPIEIAANIVWRVSDTAQALFDVDDYLHFVNIQIETALREVAQHYAYDHDDEGAPTLRAGAEIVGARLRDDLQGRISIAGLTVDEAHLMHLAYAPEIANAMLRRQQAQAIIAARQLIVTGAVGMVESAMTQLSERGVVSLDEPRKAQLASNLLVVLCADREAQPIVNTGAASA
jgi:regulator of protease activity HflC (stomatin/prohibitin superfamily)